MKLRSGTITGKITCSSKIQKNYRKKAKEKENMCICRPQMPGLVEIPLVWSTVRENTQLCDGIIICDDDVKIQVHRVILSSVSSYFKAHFTNTLNRGSSQIVEAKVNVPSHIFTKLLDFAYTGHCTIEENIVEHLLRAADEYHVLGVISLCSRYIADRLEPTNCLEIVRFARQYFCGDLEKEGKRYTKHHFVKLINEGTEFDKLTMEEVTEILEDDELNVRNEEFVYDAVRRWINVNSCERKLHLLSLLQCVRLGNLSTEFLTNNVLAWSLVAENVDCQRYVMGIIDVMHTTKNYVDIGNNVLYRPRVPYDIIFTIGGLSQSDGGYIKPTNRIETYDPKAHQWLLFADADNLPRAWHGLSALNGYIYVIGGFDKNETLNTVRRFDPVHHKWSECAFMRYARSQVGVVVHNHKIYAMGGDNGIRYLNSVERYDPGYNQWELIKPMLTGRSNASAAVLNNKIYIVGGINLGVMSSAEVYNTLADQWTFIPPMLSARSGASLVAYKNTIYALGGHGDDFDSLATGEKFTPGVSPGWEAIREMFRPRSDFAAVVLDDVIFAIGGRSDRFEEDPRNISCVECYDTDTNEWMHASPMNMKRSALGACVLSGIPNARDYSLMGKTNEVGAGTHQGILTD